MSNLIGNSYGPNDNGVASKKYMYRIVNNFEQSTTIETPNDNCISLYKRGFYSKIDGVLSTVLVEFLSLNNGFVNTNWGNQNNNCTIIKP